MAPVVEPSVVYVLPDKMGGALNVTSNLLRFRRPDGFRHVAVLTHNSLSSDERFARTLPADAQTVVEYSLPIENLHAVLDRLRRAIPQGHGVLVANDLLDLAFASAFECGRTVVQILHGDYDYYYDLAERHQHVIDAFIVAGRTLERKLKARLPEREQDVYLLPYGIPMPVDSASRRGPTEPLRLLFVGRLDRDKGVFDLPLIDRALKERGVSVTWTLIGTGSQDADVRAAWGEGRVEFLGRRSHEEIPAIAAHHDVFVLPSRFEGFPLALLEAMSAGLVPVATRLESGVAETITDAENGFLREAGDIAGFADAIAILARDAQRIVAMGEAARRHVALHHDIRRCTDAYQALFARYSELRRTRPANVTLPYGTRLDRKWIPNIAVRTVRGIIRRTHGRTM